MKNSTIMNRVYGGARFQMLADSRYTSKDGTNRIVFRVYHQGKYLFLPTSQHCQANGEVGQQVLESLTRLMDRVYKKGVELIDENTFTLKSLEAWVTCVGSEDVTTLNQMIKNKIARLEGENKWKTSANYKALLKNIEKSCGVVSLKELNHLTLKPLSDMLGSLSDTSKAFYYNSLKSVVNEALHKELIRQSQNPFKRSAYDTDGKFTVPKGKKRVDRYLTIEEMQALYKDCLKTRNREVAKFLLMYLFGGCNLIDLCQLRFGSHWEATNGMELSFVRSKTKAKQDFPIRLAITPYVLKLFEVLEIVPTKNTPLFPQYAELSYFDWCKVGMFLNNKIAYNVRKACKRLGIEKNVSPTYARHSFATIANRLQLPYNFIEYSMGHSNNNVSAHYFGGYTTNELVRYAEQLL